MAEYASVYAIFKKREESTGLSSQEKGLKDLIETLLMAELDNLEMKALQGEATTELTIQITDLRNLLFKKSVTR